MNELALFAGAGGGILGGKLLGWRTVCAVECNPYAASILCARQNDGILTPFPIWDDVRTFDGYPWQGIVDVVSGGFPCQDISIAGAGKGIEGEKSGLWSEFARIIGEVRPRYAFVENSPMLTIRGLYRVLGDLAALGYDAEWGVLGASDVGAPHKRERIWIVAHSHIVNANIGRFNSSAISPQQTPTLSRCKKDVANSNQQRCKKCVTTSQSNRTGQYSRNIAENGSIEWWRIEPDVDRVAHGVAARVDRLKAIGNGQVPYVAKTAWELLIERMQGNDNAKR